MSGNYKAGITKAQGSMSALVGRVRAEIHKANKTKFLFVK